MDDHRSIAIHHIITPFIGKQILMRETALPWNCQLPVVTSTSSNFKAESARVGEFDPMTIVTTDEGIIHSLRPNLATLVTITVNMY
jgi:hypothetical protein